MTNKQSSVNNIDAQEAHHERRNFIKSAVATVALTGLAGSSNLFAQTAPTPFSQTAFPIPAKGYAAKKDDGILSPWDFARREVGDDDVQVQILYCGVCHSDVHVVRGEWGRIIYPMVPGHEITGRVVKVGKNVKRFKVGDSAGVGTIIDSCMTCESCKKGHEQYCDRGETIETYNGPDKYSGSRTQGGYSNTVVVKEHFVFNIPAGMDLKTAAPLLCAGATMYSPMLASQIKSGMKVAIIGIGGLGHLGVKLATAKGAEVTGFTTSPTKMDDIRRFGAKEAVLVDDGVKLKKYAQQFDFVISTIPYKFSMEGYIKLAKRHAMFVQVGIAAGDIALSPFTLVTSQVNLTGSNVGGIPETQELLNFCAANKIAPEVEMIAMKDINTAFNKVVGKNVRYRYVIDMTTV
jgi:alcohol dehydrogenase (NADP+)